jgi:hypothetical protein
MNERVPPLRCDAFDREHIYAEDAADPVLDWDDVKRDLLRPD